MVFRFLLVLLSMEVESRDAYGFAVRPQHLQKYREYAKIYKEEEEERSGRWKDFLDRQAELAQTPSGEEDASVGLVEESSVERKPLEGEDLGVGSTEEPKDEDFVEKKGDFDCLEEKQEIKEEGSATNVQLWAEIRSSLGPIEQFMSARVKKSRNVSEYKDRNVRRRGAAQLAPIEEGESTRGNSDEGSEEEFCDDAEANPADGCGVGAAEVNPANDAGAGDVEVSPASGCGVSDAELNPANDGGAGDAELNPANDGGAGDAEANMVSKEPFFPWKEELECMVHGGLPMALRGELWQAFVGVRTQRVEGYYQNLLNPKDGEATENETGDAPKKPEKWKIQIEKDLPRTFPGHPALDEDGRNALRRLLTAYARHNPSVGYCQYVGPQSGSFC